MATFLGTLFLVICILLVIVILLQKGRGGGLGAAFGGAGSAAFGTRTGDVFTWVTIVLTALFLLVAVVTTLVYRPAIETLPQPGFDPATEKISEPISVTISCASAKAEIHYTLDGKDPTANSPQYNRNPIRIEPGAMIQARAFLRGWNASPVATHVYRDARKAESEPAPMLPGLVPASWPATGPAAGATAPPARPATGPPATVRQPATMGS